MPTLPRLLLAVAGGGATTTSAPPSPPGLVSVSAAPLGGAIVVNTPWGIYDSTSGLYVFAYIENNGDIEVITYNASTGLASAPVVLHAALQVDNHAAPSICLAGDGHYVVAYSQHGVQPIYWRRSTNAHDISAWDSEQTNNQGATTYCNLFPMTSEGAGVVYLFFRYHTGGEQLWYLKSTDSGATFGGATEVYANGSNLVYWHLAGNGTDRIDIVATDLVPSSSSSASLGHCYMTGGSFYKSDGSAIGATPFAFSALTKIIDGPTVGGGCFPFAISPTGPTVAVNVYLGTGTDNDYYDVRYSGGTWTATKITSAGGLFYGQQATGLAVDYADPSRYVLGKLISGAWQMVAYSTADSGAHWTQGATLTSTGSPTVHVWPTSIYGGTLRYAWLTGRYTTDTDWSTGISASS